MMISTNANIREKLKQLAKERILILDGAMGSMIQVYRTSSAQTLAEDDFRGERFKNHTAQLKGCNDILCLTKPKLISGIHEAYLKAGADIIETNSFNATAVSLADLGLEDLAYEINVAAARLARETADNFSTQSKPRFVAGVMGPTAKCASICQDINNPGKRAITWDELEAAYYDNARGLLDGGADLILIETIFDTLNAKAAIFAVKRLAKERGIDVPLIISATVSNTGGRLLSGQTLEAFCVSVLHANPLAIGLNCSFGAEKLQPHIAVVSAIAPCLVSAHPNAGLPNQAGAYDENPEIMANNIEGYLREGLVNIIGSCCGSTPEHTAAIVEKAKNYSPRRLPAVPKKHLLSGLEVLRIEGDERFADIKENPELTRLIKEGNYEDAVDIILEKAESGAAPVEVCLEDVSANDITGFLNNALIFPDITRLPMLISSSRWDLIEAALKCLSGKSLVNFAGLENGEAEFQRLAHLTQAYGAAVLADQKITAFFDAASEPV
jgi:5-methyltetrahydrofolate--homocysteine methyltransferase